MTDVTPGIEQGPWLPPRGFLRLAWIAHRAVYRITGGRRGLSVPKTGDTFGHMRLRTTGRRSGQERVAILGYFEDGPNLVTLAMNGWGDPEPKRWLNLLADPDAVVDLKGQSRAVRARAAGGEEGSRLWARFGDYKGWGDINGFSKRRSRETAVVVLEPRS